MSSVEKLYYDIRLNAYDSALHILNNMDDAEDIAQNVCLKFLQKQENILNPKNWGITVAKNEAYALLKKQRKILTGVNEKLDIIHEILIESKEEIIPEFEIISLKEAKELLSKSDYRFYKLMIKHNNSVEKMMKSMGKSRSYIYAGSYRVKTNLRAFKLLKEGYIASRDIVDYSLNKKNIYFINILNKKLKEQDVSSLHKYFKFYNKPIPKMDIVRTFEYEVRLYEVRKYKLCVPYKESNDKVSAYTVFFLLDKSSL